MNGIARESHEPEPPAVQVQGLTKRFGSVTALHEVSLAIRRGAIHALLGENGAGKSTLTQCLYGYRLPDEGRMLLNGVALAPATPTDAMRAGIAMVQQHASLVPSLTVLDNILLGLFGVTALLNRKRWRVRLEAVCAEHGVSLRLDALAGDLAVGEQLWIDVIRALSLDLKLLILDEPTAVLTPVETDQLFGVMRSLTRRGVTILLITHKLDEVMRCNAATVLRKGRVVDTVATRDTNKAALSEMMIGRVAQRPPCARAAPGAACYEIRGLGTAAVAGACQLHDIHLGIRKGEILGLAGVAGNGQRELFEVLTGVRPAASGEVRCDRQDLTHASPREVMDAGIGHVPEDRNAEGVIGPFSIAENLLLGFQRQAPYARGPLLRAEASEAAARAAVAAYGVVASSIHAPLETLSGGNAQKVVLARELPQATRVLLVNQPMRGLDIGVIETVHSLLLQKRAEGCAVLVAAEDLDDLLLLCDRVAVMFRGRIAGIVPAEASHLAEIGALMAGQSFPTRNEVTS